MQRVEKLVSGKVGQTMGFGVATLVPRLVSIGMVPVLTSYLSQAEYGRFSLVETVAALTMTVLGLGLPAAVVRTRAQPGDSKNRLITLLLLITAVTTCGVAFVWMLGPTIWANLPISANLPFFPFVAVGLGTVAVQQLLTSAQALNQATKKAWRYATIALLQSALIVGFTFWFVVGEGLADLGVLAGRLGAAILATVVAGFFLIRELEGRPDRQYVGGLLAFAIPLVPHQLVAFVLNAGDRFVIEYFLGLKEVGLYSLAYGFGAAMTLLTTVMMLMWSPRFYANVDKNPKDVGQHTLWWIVGMAAACVVALVVAPPAVRLVANIKYHAAANTVPLIMGGYFFHAAFSLFSLQILHQGDTRRIAQITVFAAFANVALNFLLVPILGFDGAALATLAAFIFEALGVYWVAQHVLRLPHQVEKYGIAGLCVILVTLSAWLNWLMAFAVGLIVLGVFWKVGLNQIWRARHTLQG